MTTFVIVRHGETEWNVVGRIQGWRNSGLTERGRTQARALGARLATEALDVLVVSDLGRTQETAAPIAAGLGKPPVLDAGLRERCYGVFEGLTWPEIAQRHPEAYARIHGRDPEYALPEGESGYAFRDRVVATFERLAAAHPGARVGVVTHGGVLGIVYRHAHRIPLQTPRAFVVPNAAVNRVRLDGAGWVVETWADVAHLPVPSLDDE